MVWRDSEPERNPYRDVDHRTSRDDEPRRPGLLTRCFTAIGLFIENILSLGFSRRHQSRETTISRSTTRTIRVNSLDELPPEIRRLAEQALRDASEPHRSSANLTPRNPDALVTLDDTNDSGSSWAQADVQRFARSVRREVRIENGQRRERIIMTDDDGRERSYDSIDALPEADRRWLRMIEGASEHGQPID